MKRTCKRKIEVDVFLWFHSSFSWKLLSNISFCSAVTLYVSIVFFKLFSDFYIKFRERNANEIMIVTRNLDCIENPINVSSEGGKKFSNNWN